MSEIIVCQKHLKAVLTADSQLNSLLNGKIFAERAPQGTPMPYLVYSEMAATDNETIGARSSSRLVFAVQAIGEGESYAPLAPIADRVDVLFQGLIGTQDGLRLRWRRVMPLSRYEMERDRRINYLGGQYRCFLS